MYVTIPVTLTDEMLIDTDAPASGTDEYPGIVDWDVMPGMYPTGQYVLYVPEQNIYRANTNTIDTDVPGSSEKWTYIARDNKFRLIDGIISSPTVKEDGFYTNWDLTGQIVGSVAAFALSGITEINITVDSIAQGGEIYTKNIQLLDSSGVIDWWTYYYAPFSYRTSFALYDLPPALDAIINIEFVSTSTAKVGELIIGNRRTIGTALQGSGFENNDLSRVTYDPDFGNVTGKLIRPNIDVVSYNVNLQSNMIGYLRNTLAEIGKTRLCAWAGSTSIHDNLLALGFYETFSVIDYTYEAEASISVRTVT